MDTTTNDNDHADERGFHHGRHFSARSRCAEGPETAIWNDAEEIEAPQSIDLAPLRSARRRLAQGMAHRAMAAMLADGRAS